MAVASCLQIEFRQHRTIWQEHSAKDFASYESYKRAGILYVFPPFITARMGRKIGRRPQTQLCGDAFIIPQLPPWLQPAQEPATMPTMGFFIETAERRSLPCASKLPPTPPVT